MDYNHETDLLNLASWPQDVTNSPNLVVLQRAVRLATTLEDIEAGDDDIDAELQYLFTRFSRLLPNVPDPQVGRPVYTRNTWDLRALQSMISPALQLQLRQVTANDKDGSARWCASLYDANSKSGNNAVAFDHSDVYGSAWTPNLALARLLIAACIEGVIRKTLSPNAAGKRAA